MRLGLAARIQLEPYAAGHILPHERTFPGPKEARLRLLRATRTKLSPILLLHEGNHRSYPIARPTSRRSSAERKQALAGQRPARRSMP